MWHRIPLAWLAVKATKTNLEDYVMSHFENLSMHWTLLAEIGERTNYFRRESATYRIGILRFLTVYLAAKTIQHLFKRARLAYTLKISSSICFSFYFVLQVTASFIKYAGCRKLKRIRQSARTQWVPEIRPRVLLHHGQIDVFHTIPPPPPSPPPRQWPGGGSSSLLPPVAVRQGHE